MLTMRASKRSRNARTADLTSAVEPVSTAYPVFPTGIKIDIAHVVRTFEFSGADWGTCLARAAVGNATLIECGLTPRLLAGGMLYRVGPRRRRDTIRFCLPDNRGGYLDPMDNTSYLIGHVWNEVSGEIADFSADDWQVETDRMYASETNLDDLKLGPVEWSLSPPEFIWQPIESLKAGWRPCGEPALGQIWYGPWFSHAMPDFRAFDQVIVNAAPIIADLVDAVRLRERVADYLHHGMSSSPDC
jgi:hypothetical protein